MSIPGSGSPLLLATAAEAAAAAEYVIPKSLRFSNGDSSNLSKTFSTAGNRRTWTWSGWVKRGLLGTGKYALFGGSGTNSMIRFNNDDGGDGLRVLDSATGGYDLITDRKFRDPSAWYHFVVAVDTTQSTSSDRVKIYVNGVQETSFYSSSYPTQNAELTFNNNISHTIGYAPGSAYHDGLMADVQFVDGQALAPSDFGETRSSDGVWVPKEFADSGPNSGIEWSSNSTNFTNPGQGFNGSTGDYAEVSSSGAKGTFTFPSSISVANNVTFTFSSGTSGNLFVNDSSTAMQGTSLQVQTISFTGTLTKVSLQSNSQPVLYYLAVDGVPLIDNLSHNYGRNGFHLNFSDSSTNEALGFDSAPTIGDTDPKKGFDVITYTGNGGTQNIGGLGFEPDFVWIKSRGSSSDHELYDSVRGATKRLFSSLTSGESAQSAGLTTFNPDGFTLGGHAGSGGSSTNYVAWCWQAGGPAVANTNGSINSQVSANTDYGFSIVSYSGTGSNATVGHGLSSAPKWILVKDRSQSTGFAVYHDAIGTSTNNYIEISSTGAAGQDNTAFQNTAPTSSVFSIGTKAATNESGDDFIAYCWSEVSGFSKFGSYTGSGSTAQKITTGFKPAFVILRDTTQAANWVVLDSERGSSWLEADGGAAENSNSNQQITFEDDGFTVDGDKFSADGKNTIYMAFADRPGNNWDVNNIVTNEGLTTNKDNFDIVTYTGTGSTQSIDSLAFQPDFVWIKVRGAGSSHRLFDSVRGAGKHLLSNGNSAEETHLTSLSGFTSNGFTLGANGEGATNVNQSSGSYVAWCWKAGGTAVSNTDGSITSSVSANTEYGFSIVTYTGAGSTQTIGHGLGKVPKMILVKKRNSSENWGVYHVGIGNGNRLSLNSTDGSTSTTTWNNTTPTSSVFSVGAASLSNSSGDTYVAYCFADVPGYQRIGSVDTGSDPVVITGFKPRFLLTKKTSGSEHWFLHDSERDPDDDDNTTTFEVNNSGAEESGTNRKVKFLDNGFQLIGSDVDVSGATSIYWAIGDDEIGSDEDCLVDVPNAVTADADATDTTGGYQRGNYCSLNPLDSNIGSNLTNGNLDAAGSSNWSAGHARGTFGLTSGKWFWEVTRTGGSGATAQIGFCNKAFNLAETYGTVPHQSWTHPTGNGQQILWPAGGTSSYFTGGAWSDGDVIGIALDMDNQTAVFYKNGVGGSTIDLTTTKSSTTDNIDTLFPLVGVYNSNVSVNFGQMRFKYPIPDGYAALNTTALADATIADGSTVFEALTYTGNGTNGRDVTGLSFSPDLVWIKGRTNMPDGYPYDHSLTDTVRGAGKSLASNTTSTESSNDSYGYISQFNSDGFRVTAGSTQDYYVNETDEAYIAWAWDAGSSTVSNTDGGRTASVRANQSAGFSICGYTGGNGTSSFGHGLSAAPEFVIVKNRTQASQHWVIYHKYAGAEYFLKFTTDARVDYPMWQDSHPTNSVVYLGNDDSTNNSGEDYIAYCFAPVAGYSAFGSYEGNGSADGVFVHTGFKVRFLIIKQYDGTNGWFMWDTERDSLNPNTALFSANANNVEQSQANHAIDFLSNGFKTRDSNGAFNGNGNDYIYIAFASNPFQANGGLAR